jgi:hypothetical protein
LIQSSAAGVVCPPNALWNGSCYCKLENWASMTHRDVMVNGACCPENAFFDWVTVNPRWGLGDCVCLDGFQWNETACVPVAGGEFRYCHKLALALGISTCTRDFNRKVSLVYGPAHPGVPLPRVPIPSQSGQFQYAGARLPYI